jgi:hypothetical protein
MQKLRRPDPAGHQVHPEVRPDGLQGVAQHHGARDDRIAREMPLGRRVINWVRPLDSRHG